MADNSLKVSELARFARNLENFSTTSPDEVQCSLVSSLREEY